MSDRTSTPLKLSTVNLSEDGARLVPGGGQPSTPVTETAALAALRSFAALAGPELADADAKIYLTGPQGKVAVQNVGGRLLGALVPESVNTATAGTPEEILAWALGRAGVPASAAMAEESAEIPTAGRPAGGWRRRISSVWTLAVLALVAAIMAYLSFQPERPEGVEMIRSPAQISRLHGEYNGRYGAAEATTLALANGRLTGLQTASATEPATVLFDLTYTFGQRGKQVVLVVENGALLEPQADGSLRFLESTYPRHAK
jgi:hypothetical protein